MGTVSGKVTINSTFASRLNGVNPKEQEFAPAGANSFFKRPSREVFFFFFFVFQGEIRNLQKLSISECMAVKTWRKKTWRRVRIPRAFPRGA